MKINRPHIALYIITAIVVFLSESSLGGVPKVPFLDMNDVKQIQANKNILSFISANGVLTFDTFNQTWTVKSKQNDKHISTKPFTFPDWVPSTYRGIKDQLAVNGNSIWLTEQIGKGSNYVSDVVIDNQNRVIYSIPYQNTQSIHLQGGSIWLGHPRGITQINRISRQRIDYELWPKFENITGWVEYNNKFYISSSDGALISYNPESGEIKSLPFSIYSFDKLFISLASKKNLQKAQFYFTNPVLRGSLLAVGVLPTNPSSGAILGQSGVMTFDLDNLENSGIVKNLGVDSGGLVKYPHTNLGIKKLVKINNDIFLLGNHRQFYEGGDFLETGGIVLFNESGRRFDLPECGNHPVIAIKAHANNQISILQQSIDPKEDAYIYFECTLTLNEPNENIHVAKAFANVTRTVRVLERVQLQENDPKIKDYDLLQFELSPLDKQELIRGWSVMPKLKAYYNRPLYIKDYHSPVYQDIDGLLYPEFQQQFLNLD